jgi:hypothetical protein
MHVLRSYLIDTVCQKGGHFAAGLGLHCLPPLETAPKPPFKTAKTPPRPIQCLTRPLTRSARHLMRALSRRTLR